MNCIHCNSNRIIHFIGKCKDMCTLNIPHLDIFIEGYSMTDTFGLGEGSDYMSFSYCVDCLKVQAKTLTDEEILSFFTYE